jgi:hypothetical protein
MSISMSTSTIHPVYIEKEETFKSWDENPIDLPG